MSDWSSDVCSSDLTHHAARAAALAIADRVCEMIRAQEIRGRRISHRAVRVSRDSAIGNLADGNQRQRIAVRVAIIGENIDGDGRVLRLSRSVIVGDRRAIGRGEKEVQAVRHRRLVVRPLEISVICLAVDVAYPDRGADA